MTASVMANQASTLDPSKHDLSISRSETIHSKGMGGRSWVAVSPYEMPVLTSRYGAMDGRQSQTSRQGVGHGQGERRTLPLLRNIDG